LSEIASSEGVFLGNELNRQGDSLEWVELIYRLTAEVGSQMALPVTTEYRSEIQEQAERILSAAPSRPAHWGLKLPETMLVLPLFIDAFPGCKVVHLIRHPISCCLRRSHMTSRLGNPVGDVVLPAAYRFAGLDPATIADHEVPEHNAYSWVFQVKRIVEYTRSSLGPSRCLELKYEDICSRPQEARAHLLAFLGGRFSEVPDLDLAVDSSRLNSWSEVDPASFLVWSICGQLGERLGYAKTMARSTKFDHST